MEKIRKFMSINMTSYVDEVCVHLARAELIG
jgi:hypothetical protein